MEHISQRPQRQAGNIAGVDELGGLADEICVNACTQWQASGGVRDLVVHTWGKMKTQGRSDHMVCKT